MKNRPSFLISHGERDRKAEVHGAGKLLRRPSQREIIACIVVFLMWVWFVAMVVVGLEKRLDEIRRDKMNTFSENEHFEFDRFFMLSITLMGSIGFALLQLDKAKVFLFQESAKNDLESLTSLLMKMACEVQAHTRDQNSEELASIKDSLQKLNQEMGYFKGRLHNVS